MKESPADTQTRKKEEGGDAVGARKKIPPTVPEQIPSTLQSILNTL